MGRAIVRAVVWSPGGFAGDIWDPTAAGMEYALHCRSVRGQQSPLHDRCGHRRRAASYVSGTTSQTHT